jgi:Nuclease A inhibitor-like protein
MQEKEKKSQIDKQGELSENGVSASSDAKNESHQSFVESSEKIAETSFTEELERSVRDLWYISETDSEVKVFIGKRADSVTKEILAIQTNVSVETNIEKRDFADFFENLTAIQDWYGDEEKKSAEKFSTVKKLLEENLKDLQVFKVGQIELDIYVVGLDSQSTLTGITTKAVET